MIRRIAIILLIGAALACQGVVKKDFDSAGNAQGGQIGDPALKALVSIVQSDTEIINGYLKVRILIHNRTHLRRELEYKVIFSDDKGFPLEDKWGWRPLNLEPKGDGVIEVKSFDSSAATYELQLQRASMDDMR